LDERAWLRKGQVREVEYLRKSRTEKKEIPVYLFSGK
jgi:hypothetical protein